MLATQISLRCKLKSCSLRAWPRPHRLHLLPRWNTISTKAPKAAHLPALINLLGQGEALGDDTAVQVDDAIKATALAIETSMAVFSTVVKLAGETEYRRYRK